MGEIHVKFDYLADFIGDLRQIFPLQTYVLLRLIYLF